MGISSIGSITTPSVDPYSTQRAQATTDDSSSTQRGSRKSDAFHGDFASLLSAIQSGDMTGAQSALQTLQSDLPSTPTLYNASGSSTSSSSIGSDLSSLFGAVKAGDLSAAQTALDQFKSDVTAKFQQSAPQANGQSGQQVHGHHHHGHHHGGGLESVVSSILDGSSASTSTSTDSSTSSTTATES